MRIFSNLSRRDRGLLMVLLVAVVFYLCYSMIITPALETSEMIKSETDAVKTELATAKDIMENSEQLEQQAADLKEELAEKYSVFFPDLNQSQLLYKLDTLMLSTGIFVSSYIPAPEAATQVPLEQGSYTSETYPLLDLAKAIQPSLYQEEEQAVPVLSQGDGSGSDMVPGADIAFSFENAAYENIYAFINTVEQMNKTVVLKNIDISRNDSGLSGQLNFAFYALPTLEEKQKDELKFVPAIPKGKTNPFQ